MSGTAWRGGGRTAGVLVLAVVGGMVGGRLLWAGADAQSGPATAGPIEKLVARELAIVDAEGRERIRLRITEAGPAVVVRDEQERPRAFMGQTGPATPGRPDFWAFNLLDVNGQPRTLNAMRDDGQGQSLQTRDSRGTIRFLVFTTDTGSGIKMKDPEGRDRFELGVPSRVGFGLAVMDGAGREVWKAP